MKIINPMSQDIIKDWQLQPYAETVRYKLIKYHKAVFIDEGVLLHNTMTKEMILITEKEWDSVLDGSVKELNNYLYIFLISHWYLIQEEYDEKTMAFLQYSKHRNTKLFNKYLETFTIFTTTDCNARCYYCYELGTKRIPMSEQIASDVADYVLKKSDPKKEIHFGWFGGEPTYNSKVIDIICNRIKDAGRNYFSSMISNAYLFDDDMVDRAVNIWKLKRIQVTIDGNEEVYNKTKAFIYKDNAFQRVIDNVGKLLNAGIQVNIRINVSEKNMYNAYQVVDILYDKYKTGNGLLHIYPNSMFENMDANLLVYTDEQREMIFTEIFKIENYIESKGFRLNGTLSYGKIKKNQCMADNPNSVIISPEGNIGVCEHHYQDDFFGSIYDDDDAIAKRDYSGVRKWKKPRVEYDLCKDCFYYPQCMKLTGCESFGFCHKMEQKSIERKVERMMKNTYEKYVKNHPKIIERYNIENSDVISDNNVTE